MVYLTPTTLNSFLHEIIITLRYHSWASNTNIVHVVKWQVFIYSHNKNKFIDCGHREMTSIIKVLYRGHEYDKLKDSRFCLLCRINF